MQQTLGNETFKTDSLSKSNVFFGGKILLDYRGCLK
jgi:hypothetical protein